jgi:hypothetical protein
MKKNTKVQVREGHEFFANETGYFQFMGGSERDCVVLSTEPLTCMSFEYPRENRYSLFAVDLEDIQVL